MRTRCTSAGIVLARLPVDAAVLAAQRGYQPGGVPILKRIGAVAPQSVCVWDRIVAIDGAMVAIARMQDGLRRPASFDSRYFGPIAASDVLYAARPIWTWSTP